MPILSFPVEVRKRPLCFVLFWSGTDKALFTLRDPFFVFLFDFCFLLFFLLFPGKEEEEIELIGRTERGPLSSQQYFFLSLLLSRALFFPLLLGRFFWCLFSPCLLHLLLFLLKKTNAFWSRRGKKLKCLQSTADLLGTYESTSFSLLVPTIYFYVNFATFCKLGLVPFKTARPWSCRRLLWEKQQEDPETMLACSADFHLRDKYRQTIILFYCKRMWNPFQANSLNKQNDNKILE